MHRRLGLLLVLLVLVLLVLVLVLKGALWATGPATKGTGTELWGVGTKRRV